MSQHAVMPLTDWKNILDKVREKTGKTDLLTAEDVPAELDNIKVGGIEAIDGGVNFYDYDGTVLYAYTVEEAMALTELPPLPKQEGLVCQGWNWTLEDIQSHNRALNIGALYSSNDGSTRIYIHLEEGRTSPMLGFEICGTVTVDWGDGTEPDIVTGGEKGYEEWEDENGNVVLEPYQNYELKFTPTHNYTVAGDYVISLTVDGDLEIVGDKSTKLSLLVVSSSPGTGRLDRHYRYTVRKIVLGENVTASNYAFSNMKFLSSVACNSNLFGEYAFYFCFSLKIIILPPRPVEPFTETFGVGRFYAFKNRNSSYGGSTFIVSLANGTQRIGSDCFYQAGVSSITLPDSLLNCPNCEYGYMSGELVIPKNISTLGKELSACERLTKVVILGDITYISPSTFSGCLGVFVYDFTRNTSVPTLSNTNAFSGIPDDCEIRVPSALYDEWISATNWSEYADHIVAV